MHFSERRPMSEIALGGVAAQQDGVGGVEEGVEFSQQRLVPRAVIAPIPELPSGPFLGTSDVPINGHLHLQDQLSHGYHSWVSKGCKGATLKEGRGVGSTEAAEAIPQFLG